MADHSGEGGALKGLRLITIDRGPEGYGFHMYTNKQLKGQYVKSVATNGPAHLSGLLIGDHILEVDGNNVLLESHQQVVERIRTGDGMNKKLLVIDRETEKEMKEKNEEVDPNKAIVMIPRSSIKTPDQEVEETDSGPTPLQLDSMSAALPKKTRRQEVKAKDWKSSVQAYNDL